MRYSIDERVYEPDGYSRFRLPQEMTNLRDSLSKRYSLPMPPIGSRVAPSCSNFFEVIMSQYQRSAETIRPSWIRDDPTSSIEHAALSSPYRAISLEKTRELNRIKKIAQFQRQIRSQRYESQRFFRSFEPATSQLANQDVSRSLRYETSDDLTKCEDPFSIGSSLIDDSPSKSPSRMNSERTFPLIRSSSRSRNVSQHVVSPSSHHRHSSVKRTLKYEISESDYATVKLTRSRTTKKPHRSSLDYGRPNSPPSSPPLSSSSPLRSHQHHRGDDSLSPSLILRQQSAVQTAVESDAAIVGRQIGEYSREVRQAKIQRFLRKKHLQKRNIVKYVCRKKFADARPRVHGRFIKTTQHTKKILAVSHDDQRHDDDDDDQRHNDDNNDCLHRDDDDDDVKVQSHQKSLDRRHSPSPERRRHAEVDRSPSSPPPSPRRKSSFDASEPYSMSLVDASSASSPRSVDPRPDLSDMFMFLPNQSSSSSSAQPSDDVVKSTNSGLCWDSMPLIRNDDEDVNTAGQSSNLLMDDYLFDSKSYDDPSAIHLQSDDGDRYFEFSSQHFEVDNSLSDLLSIC